MKTIIACLSILISLPALAQLEGVYPKFKSIKTKDYFITTNSGALSTPLGLKVGFISNPGVYLGVRTGIGKVYNANSDYNTVSTYLYSFTVGINKSIYSKGDLRLIGQLGAGYGEWWKFRWENWTKSGIELEAGLMVQKKSFLFSATGNFLDGGRTYPTGDFTLGVGFILGCR